MGGRTQELGLCHLSNNKGVDLRSSLDLPSTAGRAKSSEGEGGGSQGYEGVGTQRIIRQDYSPCPEGLASWKQRFRDPPASAFY